MKQTDIKQGSHYSDGKHGIRQVLELDNPAVEGRGAKLRYTTLHAHSPSSTGAISTMTLGAFAAWAKQIIPDDQLQSHLLRLRAQALTPRLSDTQRTFLSNFDLDLRETESSECQRTEFRAAQSCFKRGLIAQMPEQLAPGERYFDVRLSALGIAALRIIRGAEHA